jgi:DNA-binding transcriptional regulator YbjK
VPEPSGRREVLSDAAIEVIAASGMRGLTHRAVDSAADVPAGSTSYYFRSRRALLEAVLIRLNALNTTATAQVVAALHPGRDLRPVARRRAPPLAGPLRL